MRRLVFGAEGLLKHASATELLINLLEGAQRDAEPGTEGVDALVDFCWDHGNLVCPFA